MAAGGAPSGPEPSMYRHRPASERTQDISHLLTSVFKSTYTADVIGMDTGTNLIKSRGGDNLYHEKFVEELQKIHTEYNHRLTEVDIVEKHIIQARAQAAAADERALNMLRVDVGEDFNNIGLPPVKSSFRWCVDNDLLKKHNLICPEDYITDRIPITKAPKGKKEPDYIKETLSFKQLISKSPRDQKHTEIPHLRKTLDSLPDVSLSTLTLSSTPEPRHQTKKPSSKKSSSSHKSVWKDDMYKADREQDRIYLARLENRHNYLKNPRFFPPNTLNGGKSLIFPQKKVDRMITGRKVAFDKSDPQSVPVFLATPPAVLFSEYEVGQVYEMTIELQNLTSVCRHVRIIPPSTSAFAIGLGKFPGEGGLVAPGMTCQYTIQFIPEYLADYEDYILVEMQAPYSLLIPIEARRPPPVLTLPRIINCGSCLVGGVKMTEFVCRNEGSSNGKFCIMPKEVWPPPNFRAVATIGFVEQGPFGIRPAVFELGPDQAILLEILFSPLSPENLKQTFTIVCDNCQINDITVTGSGQQIALELLSVTGGESHPAPGEPTDIAAQHLIRFDPQNPNATTEKKLLIRNSTHVELPFYWQIMKPNLQPLMPEETGDLAKVKYHLDVESAFSLNPNLGILQPQTDHEFILTYAPKELKDYHSVIQIVLRDIPEPPSSEKQGMLGNSESKTDDVIALEIEVKGSTEPFQLLLEPYVIIIPGKNFIGVNVKKAFKMWNNSKSSIKYTWGKISAHDIVEVEPYTGVLEANEFCEFELNFTGSKPGYASHNLHCKIEQSVEPVVLHVEAAFKGPALSIDVPSLHLGLIKLGENVLSTFEIQNLSQLPAWWRMQESQACLAERNEDASPFTIQPSDGELPPLGKCSVSVLFRSLLCQRLQTVLELDVENGEGSHLPVFVEVQTPQACLMSSHLVFSEIYIGVPAQATVKLFNQTLLPAKYFWEELIGSQSAFCSATVSPRSGTLGPHEEKELCIELTANIMDELNDLTLCCSVEDMIEPLFMGISGQVKGLHVTYLIPCDSKVTSDEKQMLQSPQDLLLDFGSEVALKSIVTRQLILTNHTGIDAPFTLEAEYFSSCPVTTEEQGNNLSTASLVKRTAHIRRHAAKRAQSAFMMALLSHGRGVAFHAQPSTGTLKAFQQLIIKITAYNNMWGEYHDDLICRVGDLQPTLIPMQMTVKGCPIFLQMTGPQTEHETKIPIIRFGAHVSGGDTVSRCIRLNNPTPCDIRMDWKTYNQEKDNEKLVDLLLFYGPHFPIKDVDENETESNASTSETEIVLNWDKISSSPDTISPGSLVTDDVVPAGGSASIHISFTPHMLPKLINKIECEGFALGFMSLDSKLAQEIPGKVTRSYGYGVAPLRMDLQAFVKPALLTIEMDHDGGMVFHSLASDLIPNQPLSGVLTESVITHNLKLTNSTEAPLHFRILLSVPFAVSSIDPNRSLKTSHSDREEQGKQLLLHPQQNVLVKVSFHTTLELLTYQNLPADQLLSGIKVLQFENGDRKMEFSQNLVIEYSNRTTQLVPVTAYLTVPLLELSCETVDFETCFVDQTRTEDVFLLNRSRCRSYWTALLDQQEQYNNMAVFSICPTHGILEAREASLPTKAALKISFTARSNVEYETTVTVSGMLGEKPCKLQIRGRGSYDEKYEDPRVI
ncbi:deleted in lung and esophageal cancer protein 1 isoform X2 [Dermochelys coriacea]|uniref:deleted in lung and esophageal cancer protein 1 isoform X2 n=1 Tax=Dermochelys coriacea TaxID=27794 RepID=UPI001CA87F8B|nr:deleted in lung and esophageal cancer protein 1 isoform X2 [Dermochelys coriacea]